MTCLVIPEICNQIPHEKIDLKTLKFPSNLALADPEFHSPNHVDLLIGVQHFWDILSPEQQRLDLNGHSLILQNSKLGWIVSGSTNICSIAPLYCKLSFNNNHIDTQLQKFWEIENLPSQAKPLPNECETHFLEHFEILPNGKFQVAIPFKTHPSILGDSKTQTERRFHYLENKLQKDPNLRSQYINFMREYEKLGHMSKVSSSSIDNFFLPHHAVLRADSLTTKLRVVFDGSAKSSNNISLNDIQLVGPTIQSDLFTILIRFRLYKVAICADVEKMYRQISVRPQDRHFQQILWRENPNDELHVYQLNTVTYGTASAPFLAIRALHELGNIIKDKHPIISKIIQNQFYVDDLLMGCNSTSEAMSICNKLQHILKQSSFPLRKWVFNDQNFLKSLQQNNSVDAYTITTHEGTKTLGLTWFPRIDEFIFTNSPFTKIKTPTKRVILSIISKIFDPLGLISPITIKSKIFLQSLWLEKVDWDDPLSNSLQTSWINFQQDLQNLKTIQVPRCVVPHPHDEIHLHGFADASQQAYGACLYLRTLSKDKISTMLLCSKTRVSPLKPITIPKLELSAATLLARLTQQVLSILDINITSCTLWTDSTIVLSWIKLPPYQLKPFVANRVNDIQTLVPNASWKHINTSDNPADHLSRGLTSSQLQHATKWWHGPHWLSLPQTQWPTTISKNCNSDSYQTELKRTQKDPHNSFDYKNSLPN